MWTGRLQCGWRDGRCEERQTGSVSMFVCVLRERCSLGLSGGEFMFCVDLCMCVCVEIGVHVVSDEGCGNRDG